MSRGLAAAAALALVAAACGSDSGGSSDTTAAPAASEAPATQAPAGSEAPATEAPAGSEAPITTGELKPVKLQLQWFTQAQFAGYYAAVEKGFYRDEGLDVQILEGGVDIVPQTVLAQGNADFAIAWVPKALASREQGAGITDIAQIFQRSGTLQVSSKAENLTDPAQLKGKKVGNWGFGNEYELFAGMTGAGLDPSKDVTLVQQDFDMKALLAGQIDAAQAMIYNEYAQLLEAKNPATGELYTPEDWAVINWNDVGTAMLQDAIWANTDKLNSDAEYKDTAVKFVKASMLGWMYCRDNPEECADLVNAKGSKLPTGHQLWMMNEINKLIWPSENGIGNIDQAAWDQTVTVALNTKNAEGSTVITKEPDADSWTNEIADAARDQLSDQDTTGSSFQPLTVTLKEGGA
jgi:NitT/TauT family transport system substrate-binding protein